MSTLETAGQGLFGVYRKIALPLDICDLVFFFFNRENLALIVRVASQEGGEDGGRV